MASEGGKVATGRPEDDGMAYTAIVVSVGLTDSDRSDLPERLLSSKRGRLLEVPLAELDDALIERTQAKTVITPVVTQEFDVLDVAERLHALGFEGTYFALAGKMPNPALIEREVRLAAPGLVFEVVDSTQRGRTVA